MSNETALANLIASLDKTDPSTYRAFQLIIQDLYKTYYTLFPPTSPGTGAQTTVSTTLTAVTNFQADLFPSNFRLSWTLVSAAFRYEIRIGASWDTATPVISTSSNVVNLDPTAFPHKMLYGSYTFWIKPVDINGNYGDTATSLVITIPTITAPILSASVISNNVLLSWSVPTSTWSIAKYIIYKDGNEVGQINGTFKIQAELTAGTYAYKVVAVDIVGNISNESNTFTVSVSSPVDYVQLGEVDSNYGGTYDKTSNTTIGGIEGIVGAVIEETWEEHFVNNSWSSPQDQIDAGFSLYFEPSDTVGTYVEVFDFGVELAKVNITILFDKLTLNDSVVLSCQLETSVDDVVWDSPVAGFTTFVNSVRYVRVTLTFTNANNTSLAFISNLKIVADTQFTVDSGTASAVATDSGGTEVPYNFDYKQVNSVTATSDSVQPLTCIVTNITVDSFFVLVFDSTGNRVNATVNWKARGIV